MVKDPTVQYLFLFIYNRRFFKVGGPMTNMLENVRKRRTKILVMLTANQMKEQPLENTFVP